jgi:predicted RNase H-like HicB family nuclease
MIKYLIIVEKTKTGYSAYSPDLPGCIATAKTKRLVEKRILEAIAFHLAGLHAEGQEAPRSQSYSKYLTVAA